MYVVLRASYGTLKMLPVLTRVGDLEMALVAGRRQEIPRHHGPREGTRASPGRTWGKKKKKRRQQAKPRPRGPAAVYEQRLITAKRENPSACWAQAQNSVPLAEASSGLQ